MSQDRVIVMTITLPLPANHRVLQVWQRDTAQQQLLQREPPDVNGLRGPSN